MHLHSFKHTILGQGSNVQYGSTSLPKKKHLISACLTTSLFRVIQQGVTGVTVFPIWDAHVIGSVFSCALYMQVTVTSVTLTNGGH